MKSLNVVVADDHPIVRSRITSFLLSLGAHVVAEVENGSDAIDRTIALQPDIVVLDGNMPVVSGYEASRTIKATCPNVHVVLVTISEGIVYQGHAQKSNADGFIDKATLKAGLTSLIAQRMNDRDAVRVGVAA